MSVWLCVNDGPIGPVMLHSGDILANGFLNNSTFFGSLNFDYKLEPFQPNSIVY